MKKFLKLLVVDIFFAFVNFGIALLLFRLWFWLFSNKTILTILIVLTMLGLIRQLWKTVDDISAHWKMREEA